MSRVALITGGMGGLGEAICIKMAALGYKVVTTYSPGNAKAADWLKNMNNMGYGFMAYPCDVTDFDSAKACVEAVTQEVGPVDVLVNNAGGLVGRKPLPEIDDEFFDAVMGLNVRSAVMMTRFALPHLKAAAEASGGTSSVIGVGSIAGHTGGGPGAGLYGVGKAALHNIHKNWVTYHSQDRIRFNIVSPGTIDTAFHADKSDEIKTKIAAGIPLGRLGCAEDCAASFLFFASHALSGYITGQILDVNGGQFMP